MDDIEVTVYEQLLEKHSRLIDREEQDHIKSMKAERDYFNKMYPQGSAGGGGFLDTIIKGIAGKGMMGAGIAAGGVAGGIMILADVIKNLTKESKILSTVQDTVGKALGLLVDLVLLPFLPILIWGMLLLYTAIMWLGNQWQKYVVPVVPPIPGPGAGVMDWAEFLLRMMVIPYEMVRAFLTALPEAINKFVQDTALAIHWALYNLQEWLITMFQEAWAKVLAGLEENLITPMKNALENIKTSITEGWAKVVAGLEENLIGPIKKAIDSIRDSFINFINFVIEKLNTILPPGWKITPIQNAAPGGSGNQVATGSSTTNNNTFTFYGLQPEGLEQSIKNILRSWGMGWMMP